MFCYELTFKLQSGKTVSFKSTVNGRGLCLKGVFSIVSANVFAGDSTLTLINPPFEYLGNGYQFDKAQVTLKAGMKKGFPNIRETYGTMATGTVFYERPTSEGIENNLQFTFISTSDDVTRNITPIPVKESVKDIPVLYTLPWAKGVELKTALLNCLSAWYDTKKIIIQIKDGLVNDSDKGIQYAHSIGGLASIVRAMTRTPSYDGVSIYFDSGFIYITDFTKPPKKPAYKIGYGDIIGQPSLVENGDTVAIRVHSTALVAIGDTVEIPTKMIAAIESTTAAIAKKDRLNFKGKYHCIGIHHFVDSNESLDAAARSTVLILRPNPNG